MALMSTNYVCALLVSTDFGSRHWDITISQHSYIHTGTAAETVQWTQGNHKVVVLDVIEYPINGNCTLNGMEGKEWSLPHIIGEQSKCCCTYCAWGVLWDYMEKGYIGKVSTAGTPSSRLMVSLDQRKNEPIIRMDPYELLSGILWSKSPYRFNFLATPHFIRVSAVIISNTDTKIPLIPLVLLLQRALCDSNPKFWEGPAGAVEGDRTLFEAIRRETQEETGLKVSRIIQALSTKRWKRPDKEDHGCISEWVCFSYAIGVENPTQPVRLNPKEHQNFAWVTEKEVRRNVYKMLPDQKNTVLEAFRRYRESPLKWN